jgi:hypothetical protein
MHALPTGDARMPSMNALAVESAGHACSLHRHPAGLVSHRVPGSTPQRPTVRLVTNVGDHSVTRSDSNAPGRLRTRVQKQRSGPSDSAAIVHHSWSVRGRSGSEKPRRSSTCPNVRTPSGNMGMPTSGGPSTRPTKTKNSVPSGRAVERVDSGPRDVYGRRSRQDRRQPVGAVSRAARRE